MAFSHHKREENKIMVSILSKKIHFESMFTGHLLALVNLQ